MGAGCALVREGDRPTECQMILQEVTCRRTLPIPPAEIADAPGLSAVHVNRMLQGLQAAGGFDLACLHFGGGAGAPNGAGRGGR